MSRLTNKKFKVACDYFISFGTKEERTKYRMLAEYAPKYEEIYKKLADYEDAEEQGRLIVLPDECINPNFEWMMRRVKDFVDFTWPYAKAEAEAALDKMKEGQNE